MSESRRGLVAIAISLLAVVISIAANYIALLRPVILQTAVSHDIFVSNTLGGLPDAVISLSFRGVGSPEKAVVVQSLQLEITNTTSAQKLTLEAMRELDAEKRFSPIVVAGRSITSRTYLFQMNEMLPEQVARINSWCSTLNPLVKPAEQQNLSRTCSGIVSRLAGPNSSSTNDDDLDSGDGTDGRSLISLLGQEPSISKSFVKWLLPMSQAGLQKVLFVSAGSYEIKLTALDERGVALSQQAFTFSVPPTMAQAMASQFDENIRLRIQPN